MYHWSASCCNESSARTLERPITGLPCTRKEACFLLLLLWIGAFEWAVPAVVGTLLVVLTIAVTVHALHAAVAELPEDTQRLETSSGGGVVESECEGAANHTEMTADNETGIELSMRSLSIGSADQQQHAAPVGEEAEYERHLPEKASGVANISSSATSSWSNWGGFL